MHTDVRTFRPNEHNEKEKRRDGRRNRKSFIYELMRDGERMQPKINMNKKAPRYMHTNTALRHYDSICVVYFINSGTESQRYYPNRFLKSKKNIKVE